MDNAHTHKTAELERLENAVIDAKNARKRATAAIVHAWREGGERTEALRIACARAEDALYAAKEAWLAQWEALGRPLW